MSRCLVNSTDDAVGQKPHKINKQKKKHSSSRRVLPAAIYLQASLAQQLTRWEEQGSYG